MIVPLEGLLEAPLDGLVEAPLEEKAPLDELVEAPLEELVEALETGASLGELVGVLLEGLAQMGARLEKTLD